VLLLPFIEQKELYEEFRLNEPWNSEHNLRLLGRMPSLYEAPWTRRVNVPPGHTVYHVLVGPGLRLPDDFPDGTSNTILFVEAGPPVPWTKPEEIGFDPGRTVNLQGLFRDGFRACSADGKYRFVRRESDQATIRAALTRNGGEQPPDW
jgi:hypothetical protein